MQNAILLFYRLHGARRLFDISCLAASREIAYDTVGTFILLPYNLWNILFTTLLFNKTKHYAAKIFSFTDGGELTLFMRGRLSHPRKEPVYGGDFWIIW